MHLERAVEQARSELDPSRPDELDAFDRAFEHVAAATSGFGRVLSTPGFAAFAGADALHLAAPLAYGPSSLVRWQRGVFAAPYVRSFKSGRTIVVGLVDEWQAQVFEFKDGELSEPEELGVDKRLDDLSDSVSKRAASSTGSSGVRGATGSDAAQRSLSEDARRLRKQVADLVTTKAGSDGSVVVGGVEKAARSLLRETESRLAGRIVEAPELSLGMGRPALLERVEAAASTLTRDRQARLLEACLEATDRRSVGWNDTVRALDAGAVDTLLLSRGLIESAVDDADRLVASALAQGAGIEELGDAPGARLMDEAAGVAARLRFAPGSLASPGDAAP